VIERPQPTQTALIVAVPDLERAVAEHRRRLDVAASWGVPAHVTVLYPFVAPGAVDAELIAGLGEALASVEPFDCEFARSQWFGEDVVWLAPDPDQPFRDLTDAVWRRFPQHPPYGGAFDDVVPHVTVGDSRGGSLADLRAAEVATRAHLPIRTRIERVLLIAGTDAPDSWRTIGEFSLGTPVGMRYRRGT
jgi:2'-5' RNA ligase